MTQCTHALMFGHVGCMPLHHALHSPSTHSSPPGSCMLPHPHAFLLAQSIRMFDRDVRGSLPEAWSQLTGLQVIHSTGSRQSGPGVTGSIPAAWSTLTNLQV